MLQSACFWYSPGRFLRAGVSNRGQLKKRRINVKRLMHWAIKLQADDERSLMVGPSNYFRTCAPHRILNWNVSVVFENNWGAIGEKSVLQNILANLTLLEIKQCETDQPWFLFLGRWHARDLNKMPAWKRVHLVTKQTRKRFTCTC